MSSFVRWRPRKDELGNDESACQVNAIVPRVMVEIPLATAY